MSFAQPLYLYLGAVLLPGMILFMVGVRRRRRHLSKRLGDPAFVQQLSGSRNPVAGFWRSVMWLLACAAVLLALARPRWGEDSRSTTQRGAQIIIGLDVSPSMLAADEAPTRLDRAKTAIREMIARSPGDQFGLVIFSGASFTLVPLTSDRDVLFTAVEQAGVDSISRRGTVLADAIYTAARGFNDEFPGQKAIVLFSDGEDTETKPLSAARYAAGRDILIYTVGLGSPQGAPIPLYDAKGNLTGFKEDAQGNVIHSAVNEALLRAIAEAGGGAYRHASGAAREVDWLLAELADLRRAEMETYVDAQHLERFPLLLVVAVTALVLFELIPERRSAVGWKERLIAARRRQLEAYRATGSAESELERAAAS